VIALRRATPDDVPWLVELYNDEETEPFLGGRQVRDAALVLAEVERSKREPERTGRMIIEVDGERAGAMAFDELSEANRIASLGGLAVHPGFRGRGIADEAARIFQRYLIFELGFHRLELACYGFNERAIRHSERAGFVREGVKRRAYRRHGEWQDAVQFALLREDIDAL
jgi:RimJ/RimL family protein N-acetyltransferase